MRFGSFVCLSFAIAALAQTNPDYFRLQRAMSQLKGSPVGTNDPAVVREIGGLVNDFQKHLQEANSRSVDDADAVQHLTELLTSAATQPNAASAEPILKDVNRDLTIKNRFYSERMGVAGASRGMVKVSARTLVGKQAKDGLIVFCNPYRWANTTRPMKTFPGVSSPANTTMLPGYYRCAATSSSGDAVVGERMFEIGLDGNDSITIDIPVNP
jgi:hypothetical protein